MADVESQRICGKPKVRITLPMTADSLILVLVATFLVLIELGLLPQVIRQGFYCDDRTIQFKYTGDTITTAVLLLSCIVPILLVWITEAALYAPSITNCVKSDTVSRCRGSWREAWQWAKFYIRGLVFKLVLIGSIKIFLGELRPHFLDTCRPNVECKGDEYISSYICTNTEDSNYFIRDASKSFPSGHAAVSVYEAIFVIWFLQKRVPRLRSRLAIPLCQMVLMCWAVVCSLSRITDNRHHWWDVLAGTGIAFATSYVTCYHGCQNFNPDRRLSSVRKLSIYKEQDRKLIAASSPQHKEEINLNNVTHNT